MKKEINGSFDNCNEIEKNVIMKIASYFHYRDTTFNSDGIAGTIEITPTEFNDALAYALNINPDMMRG